MSDEVFFAATARRDLRHIPPRIVPAIIEFAYGDLAREPRRVGKPLQRELAGLFSARRGPYRLPVPGRRRGDPEALSGDFQTEGI